MHLNDVLKYTVILINTILNLVISAEIEINRINRSKSMQIYKRRKHMHNSHTEQKN